MATKSISMRLDSNELEEAQKIAKIYNTTLTDIMKHALREYIDEKKKDPFYRLTANIPETTEEEGKEIFKELDEMSDDDLKIVRTDTFEA